MNKWSNYVAATLCTLCIYFWYLNADLIGMHDGVEHVQVMNTCYQSFQSGMIPMWWAKVGSCNHYFMADGTFPAITVTGLFTQILPFVMWYKLHILFMILLGEFGIITYLRFHNVDGFLPACAAVITMMSGTVMAHAMLFSNFWVLNVGFLPWLLYCIDSKRYHLITVTVALMALNGPSHAIVFVLVLFTLYATFVIDEGTWRSTFKTLLRCGLRSVEGLLVASIVLVPIVFNNFDMTLGRVSPEIQSGFFSPSVWWQAFCGRHCHLPFWGFDHNRWPVMWLFYYAYIGVIPFVLMLFGMVVASFNWKRLPMSACGVISCLIMLCCVDHVWRTLGCLPLINKLPQINIVPTRMLPLLLIFGTCAMAMVINKFSLKHIKLLSFLLLLWVTVDYTLLMCSLERKCPIQIKKDDKVNVSNLSKFTADPLRFQVASSNIFNIQPMGPLQFSVVNASTVYISTSMRTNFVDKYMYMQCLDTNLQIRAKNGEFKIPPSNVTYTYHLRMWDNAMAWGALISIVTLLRYVTSLIPLKNLMHKML